MEKSTKLTEYTFYFIGGGWNTEWAKSPEEAYELALSREYNFPIDKNSFHIASEQETKSLLSLFY
jgi:hypothetical protein